VPRAIAERFGVRSIVAAPLTIEGKSLGFLIGDRAGSEFALDEADLAVLSALGTVAAVFIDKADQLAELEAALEELKGLDQAKSDFVSIASHELRTPIAVVHGIAATLHLRGKQLLGDRWSPLCAALYEQTSRLGVLVDQLLDLSRLDSGVVDVRRERFPCREHIEAALRRIAPDRGKDIVVSVDPMLEVETDPLAFERVIANLVDNAFRYGRPPIEIRAEEAEAIRLTVQDNGDGVEPWFVPQLFDRFKRSQASSKRGPEGAGLGLAIAWSFAEAIGGRLSYKHGTPHGACFTLELPIRQRTAPRGL
jgi:K+-sensing histidine kinase KdpD